MYLFVRAAETGSLSATARIKSAAIEHKQAVRVTDRTFRRLAIRPTGLIWTSSKAGRCQSSFSVTKGE